MRSKISGHIERALLGKSSDVGISALGIDSGRMTGNPESAGINRHVVGDARALQERK